MSNEETVLRGAQAVKILRALEDGAWLSPGGLVLWIVPSSSVAGPSVVTLKGHTFRGADLADALGQALTWLALEYDVDFDER